MLLPGFYNLLRSVGKCVESTFGRSNITAVDRDAKHPAQVSVLVQRDPVPALKYDSTPERARDN
jgi:hypothetical protein